jgi:hypothetical protein
MQVAGKEVEKIISGPGSSAMREVATIKTELRERWFGTLDNTIVTNYNMVWPEDMKNARSDAGHECESGTQFTCFTGTKVQILTHCFRS